MSHDDAYTSSANEIECDSAKPNECRLCKDAHKAAGLLEPLVSKDATGPMQQFAGLLHVQLAERMREQRRATQLKEQLDALKDVERKIIEREQARPR